MIQGKKVAVYSFGQKIIKLPVHMFLLPFKNYPEIQKLFLKLLHDTVMDHLV